MKGKELQRLRRRLELTQKRLAELLGVAKNTVARWERGELPITTRMERHIALLAHVVDKKKGQ